MLSRQLWSAAAAAVVLGLLLTPLVLRRRRTIRRRTALAAGGTGRRAAVAAWVEAVDTAEDLGWAAAATETPRAFQQRLDDAGVVAGRSAAALSRLRAGYERAAYAAPETPAPDGDNAARWTDVETVKGRLQERAGVAAAPGGAVLARLAVQPPAVRSGRPAGRSELLGVGVGDADVLGGGVLVDAFGAAFAAQAGLLDAAERGGGVGDDAGVEADHAELDLLGHAEQPVEVLRVDVGGQAVLGGVGQRGWPPPRWRRW